MPRKKPSFRVNKNVYQKKLKEFQALLDETQKSTLFISNQSPDGLSLKIRYDLSNTFLYEIFLSYDQCFSMFFHNELENLFSFDEIARSLVLSSVEPLPKHTAEQFFSQKKRKSLPGLESFMTIWDFRDKHGGVFDSFYKFGADLNYSGLNQITPEALKILPNDELLIDQVLEQVHQNRVFLLETFAARHNFVELYQKANRIDAFNDDLKLLQPKIFEAILVSDFYSWKVYENLMNFRKVGSHKPGFF